MFTVRSCCRAGFRGRGHGAQGPRPPTKRGLPPNPSIFISPQASHQLNPALSCFVLLAKQLVFSAASVGVCLSVSVRADIDVSYGECTAAATPKTPSLVVKSLVLM